SLSSSEANSYGCVIGLAISLPLNFVDELDLVKDNCLDGGAYDLYVVPTDRIPVPAGDTTVPTDDVLVHSSNSTDSMFDGEPTTRFPCPSDLGNHYPSPGIFSSSSYDDEFDTALNNVESSVEVSLVPTKRINTKHPQSLIIGDPTSVVQTRGMVK
nr:ribonuclease H-like domain, reverse transcriptase, RNA-dependent DNA polymerase [Tanacetum cinerariifolium]